MNGLRRPGDTDAFLNKPLEHGLVDSINGHPGEVSSHGLRPEGVPGQDGGVEVEELDPVGLVAEPGAGMQVKGLGQLTTCSTVASCTSSCQATKNWVLFWQSSCSANKWTSITKLTSDLELL